MYAHLPNREGREGLIEGRGVTGGSIGDVLFLFQVGILGLPPT
jgi:hypothetical protein